MTRPPRRPLLRLFLLALLALVPATARADAPGLMYGEWRMEGWRPGRPYVNVRNLCRPWGSPLAPWDESVPASGYSADGYPRGDFGGYLDLVDYPAGTYAVSIKGRGTITWYGAATNATQTSVTLAGNGRPAWFSVTGTSPDDPVRDVRILTPGYDPAATFTPEFVALHRGFRAIRFMEWERPNVITAPLAWADRPRPTGTQTVPTRGVALEHVVELCNLTGCDCYLNVPHTAAAAYYDALGQFLAANLRPGLKVYLAVSNEPWNSLYPQLNALHDEAGRDATLTETDNWGRVYDLVGHKLRDATLAMRPYLGERLRPVLEGQAVSEWWTDVALAGLDRKWGAGTARSVVWGVALADYQRPRFKDEVAAGVTVDALFASAADVVATDNPGCLARHRATGAKYGVAHVVAYEGGPHWTDDVSDDHGDVRGNWNHALHAAAHADGRMGALMRRQIGGFGDGGGELWGSYVPLGGVDAAHGQWWGAAANLSDLSSPKWLALQAAIGGATPPPPITPSPPPATPPTTAPAARPTTVPTTLPTVITTVTIETPVGTLTFTPAAGAKVTVK